jgi:para-aminobenzoate synthetase component I
MTPPEIVRFSLSPDLGPDEVLDRLGDLNGRVLLESRGPAPGRTLVTAAPRIVVEWNPPGVGGTAGTPRGERTRIHGPDGGFLPRGEDPLALLGHLIRPRRPSGSGRETVRGEGGGDRSPSRGGGGVPTPFVGGWIGYLGYEVADLLEVLPPPPSHPGLPTLWFGAFDWAVVWDPGEPPRLEGAPIVPPGSDRDDPSPEKRYTELRTRMEWVLARLRRDPAGPPGGDQGRGVPGAEGALEPNGPSPTPHSPSGSGGRLLDHTFPPLEGGTGTEELSPTEVRSSLGERGYLAGVERIREYILAGDIFQANLTHLIEAPWEGSGLELYRALRRRSPAPFAAYLDTGHGEVASISPESFLELRGDRIRTRPIKGTAPRGRSEAEDKRLARALRASEKDAAENVMIVDLLRNDLSRVSRPGSVQVPSLLALETHPSVHHLVSTVEGRLNEGLGPVDLLRATVPGGSITGAPKIRAMEILRELEPVRRGVYTGALGLIEFSGDLTLSVAIRTAVLREGWACYGVGGGITLASDPAAEWRESLAKALPFLQVVGEGCGVGVGGDAGGGGRG